MIEFTEIQQKALSGLLRFLAKDAQSVGDMLSKQHAVFLTDLFQRIDAKEKLGTDQLEFLAELSAKTSKNTEEVMAKLPENSTEAMRRAEVIKQTYDDINQKVKNEQLFQVWQQEQQSTGTEPTGGDPSVSSGDEQEREG